jgi:hypothetical protein
MPDQFSIRFPACLEAEPVQISHLLVQVATDAARFNAGRSQERGKSSSQVLTPFGDHKEGNPLNNQAHLCVTAHGHLVCGYSSRSPLGHCAPDSAMSHASELPTCDCKLERLKAWCDKGLAGRTLGHRGENQQAVARNFRGDPIFRGLARR